MTGVPLKDAPADETTKLSLEQSPTEPPIAEIYKLSFKHNEY